MPEYLQFLYIAKGSLAETLTRAIGLQSVKFISTDDFEDFDKLHYEVENKLLRLIESLENKRGTNEWRDTLPPTIHQSTSNPLNPMKFLAEIREGLGISWDAIRANKMRSVLATLGIVIGIVTVTLMGAAINGLNQAFIKSISALGADVFYVSRNNWFNNIL